jgi:tetratricopeptide (TPR) repeat protein
MPIQLILFLTSILAGFLYLTFLNTTPVPIRIHPDITINLPVSLSLLAAFTVGVVTVMLLYFYDTFANAIKGARKSALEKRAQRVLGLYDTGAEQLRLDNAGQAEKYFRKALAHDQNHTMSIIGLGVIRRMDGMVSEAIKLHSKARGIDENSVTALMELGEDYIAAEQFSNAISVFQDAISLAGNALPPHIRMRDILLKTRNLSEAIAAQKRIVSISPRGRADGERAMLTALIYEEALEKLAEGLFYPARDGFKSVIRNDNQFIPAYLKLAEVYERLGSTKDANKTLEKGFKATRSVVVLKALEMFLSARGEMGEKS